jgi:hypothetical protein
MPTTVGGPWPDPIPRWCPRRGAPTGVAREISFFCGPGHSESQDCVVRELSACSFRIRAPSAPTRKATFSMFRLALLLLGVAAERAVPPFLPPSRAPSLLSLALPTRPVTLPPSLSAVRHGPCLVLLDRGEGGCGKGGVGENRMFRQGADRGASPGLDLGETCSSPTGPRLTEPSA